MKFLFVQIVIKESKTHLLKVNKMSEFEEKLLEILKEIQRELKLGLEDIRSEIERKSFSYT